MRRKESLQLQRESSNDYKFEEEEIQKKRRSKLVRGGLKQRKGKQEKLRLK